MGTCARLVPSIISSGVFCYAVAAAHTDRRCDSDRRQRDAAGDRCLAGSALLLGPPIVRLGHAAMDAGTKRLRRFPVRIPTRKTSAPIPS